MCASLSGTGSRGSIPHGHLVPGYEKILNHGYGAIRKTALDWINDHKNRLMGDDVTKYMFYRSAVLAADAGSLLCRRYGEAGLEKAQSERGPKRRAELEMMAGGLEHISENPARTYIEACQAVMMYLMLPIISLHITVLTRPSQ